jgi:hypothetical protein
VEAAEEEASADLVAEALEAEELVVVGNEWFIQPKVGTKNKQIMK